MSLDRDVGAHFVTSGDAAESSELPGGLAGFEAPLRRLAGVAVVEFADCSLVSVEDDGGGLRVVAVDHAAGVSPAARGLEERYSAQMLPAAWSTAAIAAGVPVLHADVTPADLVAASRDEEHLRLLRALDPRSAILVPLVIDGAPEGVVAFLRGPIRTPFAAADLPAAERFVARAARAIEAARRFGEVRRALAERNALLLSSAHDLKNLVTPIRVRLEVLQDAITHGEGQTLEGLALGLAQIEAATGRLARLADDLLDVAHLQVGQATVFRRQPTELVGLVRDVVAEHQQMNRRHRITLVAEVPELTGHWDGDRLIRAVHNLVHNAVKYSPGGGDIEVVVREEAVAGTRWATVSVTDHGLGILSSDLPYIFRPFHRGANVAPRIEGTGIGLAAVQHIVDQHGGTVTVASGPGVGSAFTIRLPLGAGPRRARRSR